MATHVTSCGARTVRQAMSPAWARTISSSLTHREIALESTPPLTWARARPAWPSIQSRNRLYVYNRFDGSISTVDTVNQTVTNTLSLFDPTPQAIKAGRPLIYNTQISSGLGQASCASCHVDTRFDRLAWDLGDPTDVIKVITNANFANFVPTSTNNYHPMKGPMVTLTLQDIIGHEPFHWRGDRDGIEQFTLTFTNLQAAPAGLTSNQVAAMKSFLATVRFPPNPYRQFNNSLSTNVPLPGQFALGRGVLAGTPLPNGNAGTVSCCSAART